MRRDVLYLADIIEAADAIARFVVDVGQESFLHGELLQSAVLHKLTVIGEAAARLSQQFRRRYPEIEWADIVGFRNIAVHAYFSVDWKIVWFAATKDAPELRQRIAEIMSAEYPESTSLLPSEPDPPGAT
jgi:uncharacterized protein with HEPN domain